MKIGNSDYLYEKGGTGNPTSHSNIIRISDSNGNTNVYGDLSVDVSTLVQEGLTVGSNDLYVDYVNNEVGIGTASPDTALHVMGEIKSVVSGVNFYMVPKGAIMLWSGDIADIPSGWALCDGTLDTPDLRNKFVMSVQSAEDPGTTGGSSSYTLSVNQLPSHSHSGTVDSGGSHIHTGTAESGGARRADARGYSCG